MTEIPGRTLALAVMDKVENDKAYANLAIQEILSKYPETAQREKSFCTELVYGSLRHLLKIDYILGRLLSRPLKSLNTTVKNTLRLALYQLIYLPEIPERAVCHSAVSQIKQTKFKGLAPLVNGVLRTYLRSRENLQFPDKEDDYLKYLEIEYSHPHWLIKRWLNQFGKVLTEQILKINNERPPLTVRLNTHLASKEEIVARLKSEGVEWTPGQLLPVAISLENLPQPLEKLQVFNDGYLFVQDESSMLVAEVIHPKPGSFIIDICAAPGGKSTHLAQLMHDSGQVISVDDHSHKVELIRNNAYRLKLQSIRPSLGDARSFKPIDNQLADAVLVDAPCSGTGVLRRRVDARYQKSSEDITQLVSLQREILKNAAGLVKPGGCLVYSTCSLEKEEDEDQIKWFLESNPQFELENCRNFLPKNLSQYLAEADTMWLKILPISGGGDGFFICRMRRILPT